MSEVRATHDDEIDLFELFETLWAGKWKIMVTTVIAAMVGVVFSLVKPNSFEASTPIQNGKPSVFIDYIPINDVLKDNGLLLTDKNSNGYLIDAPSVFLKFIDEFNDYEEMVNVLGKDTFVSQSIKDLDDDDKRKALIDYAKSFVITPPSKREKNWMLSFEWHDDVEGARLFNEALLLTLTNVKTTLLNDIDKLAASIDMKTQREVEVLSGELNLIQQTQKERNNSRIQYLLEQSAIAKELGIESNRLDANALSQAPSSGVSLNISSNEVPFYLRGFKAIDKEISLIRNRSEEEQLLMATGYVEVREKILSVEHDLSSSQLRSLLKSIDNANPNDWVEFDLALADSESQKKSMLYVALSIVLGGMLGVMYVFISNAIGKRKEHLVKA